jgi:hypothetical protein
MWKELSGSEKSVFEELAKKEKLSYLKAMEVYKNREERSNVDLPKSGEAIPDCSLVNTDKTCPEIVLKIDKLDELFSQTEDAVNDFEKLDELL